MNKTSKTIVITGASAGIGEASALVFAENGWTVILGARRKERLDSLTQKINSSTKGRAFATELDVTLDESVSKFANFVETSSNGQIDVLLNNAGLALGTAKVAEGAIEEWSQVINTNVMGLLKVTRALLPKIMTQPEGHIVNLGSIASYLVYEGGGVYCASKHAVRAITKTLRLELNGLPIRVTSIDPGMVETEFSNVRLGSDEKAKAVYKGLTPLTGDDIAECIWWSVTRPAHVNIDEIVVMPVAQAAPHKVFRT